MNSAIRCVAAVGILLFLASSAASGAEEWDVCVQSDIRSLKALLYQNVIERDGHTFTAAVFADPEVNGLRELGLSPSGSEDLRKRLEKDFKAHQMEYLVRAHVAQRRTAGKTDREVKQQALWDEFLGDSRFMDRLCPGGYPPEILIGGPRPRVAQEPEIRKLYAGIEENLQEVSHREGCAANPLTVFSTLDVNDALLAADLFEILVASGGSGPTLDVVEGVLAERGWTIALLNGKVILVGTVCESDSGDVEVYSGSYAEEQSSECKPLSNILVTLGAADGTKSRQRTSEDGLFSVGPVEIAGREGDFLRVDGNQQYKGLFAERLGLGGTLGLERGMNKICVRLPTPACGAPD